MLDNSIHVSGARERNLKNIHIKIPKKKNYRFYRCIWFWEIFISIRYNSRRISETVK